MAIFGAQPALFQHTAAQVAGLVRTDPHGGVLIRYARRVIWIWGQRRLSLPPAWNCRAGTAFSSLKSYFLAALAPFDGFGILIAKRLVQIADRRWEMGEPFAGYNRIVTATDFSQSAESALWRAVWVAQQSCRRLVVASVVADLKKAVSRTSYRSRIEFLEGQEEHFQRELRRNADDTLKRLIGSLGSTGIEITYETLLGEPYVELIHSVQQEKYDLLVAGTRGHSALKQLVLGSTAKRLIRQCPASVWIVKHKEVQPPKSILAAVDLSEVSRRALDQAVWIARQASAQLHVLHVIESAGLTTALLDTKVAESTRSLRELIEAEVQHQFREFLLPAEHGGVRFTTHLLWGSPAHETVRQATQLSADLIVLGTVGRGGVEGLLLGNTAESILAHCDCDVLTVKPAEFVSPVRPASWPLHPGPTQTG
jgi:universal stress protein E